MDLTGFLRLRSVSDSSASPSLNRVTRASSGPSDGDDSESTETSNKHPRLGLHKARRPIGDRRTRGADLENQRKSQRGKKTFERRGIMPSDVVIEEEEEVMMNEPASAKVEAPRSTRRQPLKQRQPAAATAEEMKRKLDEFRKLKEKKKLEEAKSKKPPFKVGVYKQPPTVPDNFQFGRKMTNIVFGGSSNKFGSTVSLSRPLNTTTKGTKQQLSSVSSTASRPRKGKLVGKNIPFDETTVDVSAPMRETKQIEDNMDNESQKQMDKEPSESIESNPETIEPGSQGEVNLNASSKTFLQPSQISSPRPTSSTSAEGSSLADNVESSTALSTPPASAMITIDNIVFKTPIGITPMSKKRGRQSIRRTGAGLLLDGLRSEICMERGSSSDRKRRRYGLPASRTPAEILGIEDIISDVEKGSPCDELLKKYASPPISNMRHDSELKATQPRKLDADFDEISANEAAAVSSAAAASTGVTSSPSGTVSTVKIVAAASTEPENNADTQTEVHDVAYFRRVLKAEMDRLELLCQSWMAKVTPEKSEEVQDQIRAAVGLARLGMDRKGRFRQFEGLIDDCELKRGEKETTCEDLQGFWDMIYFQIEDLHTKFSELSTLESNGWQKPEPEKKKVTLKRKVPIVSGVRAKAPGATGGGARSNIRALIEAKRRAAAAMADPAANAESADANHQNESTFKTAAASPKVNAVEKKSPALGPNTPTAMNSFDGGFFQIKSPVRSNHNTPKTENLRKSVLLTVSNRKETRRASLLMMSSHHLRRSLVLDDEASKPETAAHEPEKMDIDEPTEENIKVNGTGNLSTKASRPSRRKTMLDSGNEPETVSTPSRSRRKSAAASFVPDIIVSPAGIEGNGEAEQSGGKKSKKSRSKKSSNLLTPNYKPSVGRSPPLPRVTRRSMATPAKPTKTPNEEAETQLLRSHEQVSRKQRVNFEITGDHEDNKNSGNEGTIEKSKRRSSVTVEKLNEDLNTLLKFTPKGNTHKSRRVSILTPSRSSKRKASTTGDDDDQEAESEVAKKSRPETEAANETKKSRRSIRASVIPDLINFDASPVAAPATPAAVRRGRKSVHNLLDSSPMTPRRSARLSTFYPNQH